RWANRVEGVEEPDDGVQRIDTPPRPGRRVRGLAEVLDLGLHEPERRPPDLSTAPRVDHHRGLDVVEHPGVHELDLARAAFLGGGSPHRGPAPAPGPPPPPAPPPRGGRPPPRPRLSR